MKQKRLIEKLNNLKNGDTIVIYYPYDNRNKPYETSISKIGRKYISFKDGYRENKVDIVTYCGEYGVHIFPGNMSEYEEYKNTLLLRQEIVKLLNKEINNLSIDEIKQIEAIIKSE